MMQRRHFNTLGATGLGVLALPAGLLPRAAHAAASASADCSRAQLLHSKEDGLHIDAVQWGWAPFWAKGKRPDPINARVETVTTGKFFKQLWPTGRAIVPSEGWYEWVKDPDEPKKKQPYFIRLKSRRPMFFGALA